MTDSSESKSRELLDMSKKEVSNKFDNAEDFAGALADSHITDLSKLSQQKETETFEEKREELESLFLNTIQKIEIWE